ncbi:FXYD domain-containing ion transport regulator 5 [Acomys russatus]|uniref:FXYD domain-containing ion transport regulator 5 n=1 Tax=Acomys russatus TaxID=60746 RepID=UPI0021E2BB48|nr:FXYD domain-containing ion transport regulator 5 [Acomys russatus]
MQVMSPSSRLRLLTIVALILPSRGQTSEKAVSSFTVNQTSVNTHVPVPDKTSPEVPPTPPFPTRRADEATGTQTVAKTKTQQPTGMNTTKPMTNRGTHKSSKKGKSPVSDEKDPFYYDDATLRKRGLLVAAVLFITGIVILTSGKYRQLSRLCLSRHRAYRVVNTKGSSKEETSEGRRA